MTQENGEFIKALTPTLATVTVAGFMVLFWRVSLSCGPSV